MEEGGRKGWRERKEGRMEEEGMEGEDCDTYDSNNLIPSLHTTAISAVRNVSQSPHHSYLSCKKCSNLIPSLHTTAISAVSIG